MYRKKFTARFIIIAIIKQSKVLAISLPAVLRRTVLHYKIILI